VKVVWLIKRKNPSNTRAYTYELYLQFWMYALRREKGRIYLR